MNFTVYYAKDGTVIYNTLENKEVKTYRDDTTSDSYHQIYFLTVIFIHLWPYIYNNIRDVKNIRVG